MLSIFTRRAPAFTSQRIPASLRLNSTSSSAAKPAPASNESSTSPSNPPKGHEEEPQKDAAPAKETADAHYGSGGQAESVFTEQSEQGQKEKAASKQGTK